MRMIEIDLDVHKALENERQDFNEPDVAILKRLLKMTEVRAAPDTTAPRDGGAWRGTNRQTGKVVSLPSNEKLVGVYNADRIEGVVRDGMIEVKGERYSSLSRAATEHLRTKTGKRTALNGWKVWHVLRNGRLVRLADLR